MFKLGVQKLGRYLSGMVIPNIGAFIAWGFITALFIPTGWIPNEHLAKLVGPMITYLLPLLIGYTGGSMIYGKRGGVLGAIATMGVIIGSNIPMFLGAMIMGVVGAYVIKKVDEILVPRIPTGFEMLVNNFSAGIIGGLLALVGYLVIGGVVTSISNALGAGVNALVSLKLLPAVSFLVEPAKVLFLNNAINHGVFTPLGTEQVATLGRSIFFLIEANPGPGLGLLFAYMLFGKGNAKQSAPGAIIIHFFGGIHEVYFPYVLMKPQLIIAMIGGGIVNVATLMLFNAGLVSPASPGSIIAVFAVAARGSYLGILFSVVLSALVSCLLASLILKVSKDSEDDLETFQSKTKAMKAESKGTLLASITNLKTSSSIQLIVVACDAGMGSSAMGAALLRKKIKAVGLNIEVTNLAIDKLTGKEDIVITHKLLSSRAMEQQPNAQHLAVTNFMDKSFYDDLVTKLKNTQ